MTDELTTLSDWIFAGWGSLLRILVVGVLAYVGLLLVLRISGKRTLSKMNAFDLVVTVALGSTLSTSLLSQQTSVADGLAALTLLIALQYAVAWLSVRWTAFKHLIKSEPALLLHQGRYLREAMRRERVSDDEILAALRGAGVVDPDEATAVVLETDGSFTVLKKQSVTDATTLTNVRP